MRLQVRIMDRLESLGRLKVQTNTAARRQIVVNCLPNKIISEALTHTSSQYWMYEAVPPCFVETVNDYVGAVAAYFSYPLELEFLADHCGDRENVIGIVRKKINASANRLADAIGK